MELIFRKGIVKNAYQVAMACNNAENVGLYKKALTELLHKDCNYILKKKEGYIASKLWATMKNKDLWAGFFDKKLINIVTRELKRNKSFRESIFGIAKQMADDYKNTSEYYKDAIKKKVKPKILKSAKN